MDSLTRGSILVTLLCIVVVTCLIKAVNWVWFKPKKLERVLRQQGFSGNPYRILFGDFKDFVRMRTEGLTKPVANISDDYYSRADPPRYQLSSKFGMLI